jgi:diguanylate cyclase (GGDEF)-like protein
MIPSTVPDKAAPALAQRLNPMSSADTGLSRGAENTTAWLNLELESTDPQSFVLLVEPCPAEAARLRNELIAGQFEVFVAGDLISVAHALSLIQPNLVLAQVRLPTFGGLELVRWLKEQHATRLIPVILYSDITTAEERIQALDLGAIDLLSKPLVSAELIARVRAALKSRRTLSILERRAHHDSLTGLSNRGVFEEHLLRQWDLCRRRTAPLSVVIVDLDHFKVINDTYGHAAGDVVLRQAAQILAHSVRSSDLVARYGGEEFVVVAPDCPLAAAVTLSKRFRTNLADHTISTEGMDIRVTASVGITTADWTQTSPAELFNQADDALYRAKRSGRDAIWVYDTSRRMPTEAGLSID